MNTILTVSVGKSQTHLLATVCEQCGERPATKRYQSRLDGSMHEYCAVCAASIQRTSSERLEVKGPADSPYARHEYAYERLHDALDDVLCSQDIDEAIAAIQSGRIEIAPEVGAASAEFAEARQAKAA